jgi:hypothetical protein
MASARKNIRRLIGLVLIIAMSAGFTSPLMAGPAGSASLSGPGINCCSEGQHSCLMPYDDSGEAEADYAPEGRAGDGFFLKTASASADAHDLNMLCCLPHSPVLSARANAGVGAGLPGLVGELAAISPPSLVPSGLFRPPRV